MLTEHDIDFIKTLINQRLHNARYRFKRIKLIGNTDTDIESEILSNIAYMEGLLKKLEE